MQNEWILDVLADLKTFASANGLPALAEQLDDTTLVAAAEIASCAQETHDRANGTEGRVGQTHGGLGRREHARGVAGRHG